MGKLRFTNNRGLTKNDPLGGDWTNIFSKLAQIKVRKSQKFSRAPG